MAKSVVESSIRVVTNVTGKSPIHILHVDDETGLLKISKQYLEMEGEFRVDTASCVKEAMKKMKKETFDVIVSDYRMPEEDGLEFLKELRDSGNNIPFIIFTGKGRKEVAVEALNLGADQYLNKAGDPETVYSELAHNIRQIVERQRSKEMLGESEDKYRTLFELCPDSIVAVDIEGVITSCNPAATRMLGYSADELVNKHFSKIGVLQAKDIPEYSKLFSSVLEGNVTQPLELVFYRKDKTPLWAETRTSLLKENGKTIGVQAISRDITKRKGIEETYRELIELRKDIVYTLDNKGKITFTSAAAKEILGYKPEELIGKHFIVLIPEEWKKKTQTDFNNLLRTGEIVAETVLLDKKNRPHFVEYSSTVIKEGNKIVGTRGIVQDITERKKAERELKTSRKHFKTLFNLMVDPVAIVDRKGKILEVTERVEEITGFKREELIGKNFLRTKIATTKSKAIMIKNLTKRMIGMNMAPYEIEILTKDNRKIPYEINAAKIEYMGKSADMVVFRDISERKKAEKAVVESSQKFERLFMDNPEAAVYVDSYFQVMDVNPRFTEFFGYSISEVKGKTLFDVIVPEEKLEEGKMLDQKVRKGYVYHSDTIRKRKDGALIPVSISAAPITVEGQIIGYVGLYKDISQLKRTEKAVKETMMKLATMNEKLRVVGSLTRHDVRNKLSVVTGNVYLARKKATDGQEEYLAAIESACCQVERIFDFARYYERLGLEELTYIDVGKSFQEAVQLFPHLHNVKVLNDCDGLMVLADSLLRQLFYNLIDNSLKYGEKVSQIRVYFRKKDNNQLELVYEDDGVGLPISEKEKIFREGYGQGTGYGLYLIRKMCEVYGWIIKETGKQGEGAQFRMIIPGMNEGGKSTYKL